MAAGGGRKAIFAAMAANAGIAVAKFLAFLVTRSSSMLAESIHSIADTSNQGLLLLGSARAERSRSTTHQFGYGRERYFWAFVVSLVLFSLGGLFALFEGIDKIRDPHEAASYAWAVGVLIVAFGLEGYSFRTAVAESRPLKGSRSWAAFIRRARTPELPVVLLEDAGALVGLLLALAGVGMTVLTGDPVWDGIATVAIGVLLVAIALTLTVEMKSLLIGESATGSDQRAMERALAGAPGVRRVIDLRSQHLGPDEILVAGKVEFARGLSFTEVATAIDGAEAAIRDAVPAARIIYLEPDVYDEHHVDTPDRLEHDAGGGHHP